MTKRYDWGAAGRVEGCAVGRRALCGRRLYKTVDKKERVRVPSEDWPG